MHNLEVQWETHRKPLDEEKENLKQLLMNKKQQMQQKMEETKQLRQEIDDLNADLTGKENLIKELNKEMESVPKDPTKTSNRQFFTKRILEIVSNIDKQKKEIDKVRLFSIFKCFKKIFLIKKYLFKILIETKGIQKEINQLTGKLERIFNSTDELIFKVNINTIKMDLALYNIV
jgi:hypothetical protein